MIFRAALARTTSRFVSRSRARSVSGNRFFFPATSTSTTRRFVETTRSAPTTRVMASVVTTQSQNASPSRTHNGLTVLRVPVLNDNYAWLVHDEASGATAVVDPAEVDPIVQTLEAQNWTLTHILNTHHHWDHTGGNLVLKERFQATIVGPKADRERIPGIDVELADGDEYSLGSSTMICFDTPGHTKGHITLYFPNNRALFPGDTLFSMVRW